jgi:hypothetical protein
MISSRVNILPLDCNSPKIPAKSTVWWFWFDRMPHHDGEFEKRSRAKDYANQELSIDSTMRVKEKEARTRELIRTL